MYISFFDSYTPFFLIVIFFSISFFIFLLYNLNYELWIYFYMIKKVIVICVLYYKLLYQIKLAKKYI